jgi:hypothetical protein
VVRSGSVATKRYWRCGRYDSSAEGSKTTVIQCAKTQKQRSSGHWLPWETEGSDKYRGLVTYTVVLLCLLKLLKEGLDTGVRGDLQDYLYISSGLPEGSTVARVPVNQWVHLWDCYTIEGIELVLRLSVVFFRSRKLFHRWRFRLGPHQPLTRLWLN